MSRYRHRERVEGAEHRVLQWERKKGQTQRKLQLTGRRELRRQV